MVLAHVHLTQEGSWTHAPCWVDECWWVFIHRALRVMREGEERHFE